MKQAFVAVALLALVAPALAGEITLFEHDNFAGRTFAAGGPIDNLANSGFNDKASSVIVRDGAWQLCDDAYFRGRCVTLPPGSYPSLAQMGLNDRVSSARQVGGRGPPPSEGGGWGAGL